MEKISAKDIFKKHKKNNKKDTVLALQLTMKELQENFNDTPKDKELYRLYIDLKKQNFIIYNILPQILIGAMIGLATGITVGEIQNNLMIAIIIGAVILTVGCIYVLLTTLLVFKIPYQILIEFQIKLIEEKLGITK